MRVAPPVAKLAAVMNQELEHKFQKAAANIKATFETDPPLDVAVKERDSKRALELLARSWASHREELLTKERTQAPDAGGPKNPKSSVSSPKESALSLLLLFLGETTQRHCVS